MSPSLFALAALAVGVVLAGCATPRYETITHHIPPSGSEGLACLKGCEDRMTACRSDCEVAWQGCTARLEPQVDDAYARALKDYAAELRLYSHELNQAQWNLWLGWGHYSDDSYRGLWYSPWPYHGWPGYWYPSSPPPGDPPSRDEVRTSLQKAHCKDDCGCQSAYDACFQGCGGRLLQETRCVANCPAGK